MPSNFAFVQADWPEIYSDCARAESYLFSDPRAACIYSRRAIELLVKHLYALRELPEPYKADLAARINAPAFKQVTGNGINAKLTLIRKLGNTAAHETHAIPAQSALHALRELHHVIIWAAFNHSAAPESVPTGSQFDPKIARQAAPLTAAEAVQLAERFAQQDAAHAAELAARDEKLAQLEAQIATERAKVVAAQASKTVVDDHDYTEAETRDAFIDQLLKEAGWLLTDPRDREYKVTGMPSATGVGYIDYVLWGTDGLPLGIIEAKRAKRSIEEGRHQAKLYADCLEREFGCRPVIFTSNGYEHSIWDDASGYPPRDVQGFFTRAELELMVQRRTTRRPLTGAPVNSEIAGRYYQTRAIAAVDSAFDRKQREALLVMATGSGKTRTVIALIDQLSKAEWVKRVLFLADRQALVKQATNAFKAHAPGMTAINLLEEKNAEGRVYTSTYQTMLGQMQRLNADGKRVFGPGHFDLIVIDEAHRSVYAKYGAIFEYFDSLLVGLTATPKDEVDHNTYRLFHLEDGVPTDAYGLDEAVRDGYLVPPGGVSVSTRFMDRGIRYDELSEAEQEEWDALEWGEDGPPDEVSSEELNRFFFNEQTVDQVLATLMSDGHKVDGGETLGKTIIFAKNQLHAEFIESRFNLNWPEYGGAFARVITHGTEYAQNLIDDFSVASKRPQIAISVDMLDTGIDVPEVCNLVFFKSVRSKSKFWQMIGRGTRLRRELYGPGEDKEDFLVFDWCRNLEYFSQDLPGVEGSTAKSLTQRIVEQRVRLVTALDGTGEDRELRASAARHLHEFVSGMTLDNVIVRPHRRAVEKFSAASAWESLSTDDAAEVVALAGLPSAVIDSDVNAKRFDLLVLRAQLAVLEDDARALDDVRAKAQAICSNLLGKDAIPAVKAQLMLLEAVAGDEWWVDVTLPMLELARTRLRSLVTFVTTEARAPIYTDFKDTLSTPVYVELPGVTPGLDRERFRAKAAAYLRAHESNIALQRLRRNRQLTDEDLSALERMLLEVGDASAVSSAASAAGGLGVFVRSLVGLDRAAAQEAFAAFLDSSRYSVEQIRFVELVIDELTRNGVMQPGRLFESPYSDYAPTGPDMIFNDADVTALVDTLNHIHHTATAPSGAA